MLQTSLPFSFHLWIFDTQKPPHTVKFSEFRMEAFWGNQKLVKPCPSQGLEFDEWKERSKFNEGFWLEFEKVCVFGIECYYVSLKRRKRKQWIVFENHLIITTTANSPLCSCPEGFKLSEDRHTCIANDSTLNPRDWRFVSTPESFEHLNSRCYGSSKDLEVLGGHLPIIDTVCKDPFPWDTRFTVSSLLGQFQSWKLLSKESTGSVEIMDISKPPGLSRKKVCPVYDCGDKYGWYSTIRLKSDSRVFTENLALPKVFLFPPIRPVLATFSSHEEMFKTQAVSAMVSKLNELNFNYTLLGNNVRMFGSDFEVKAYFCKPPPTVERLTVTCVIKEYSNLANTPVKFYRHDACYKYYKDFDDTVEVFNAPANTYGESVVENWTGIRYVRWDGTPGNAFQDALKRWNISDNISTPYPYVGFVFEPIVNLGGYGFPLDRYEVISRGNDVSERHWSTQFGNCVIPADYENPSNLTCVDNLGNEHSSDNDGFNFQVCRISNSATCFSRYVANAITSIVIEDNRLLQEWEDAGRPFDPLTGISLLKSVSPNNIRLRLAQAAVDASINCPSHIDDGNYPLLITT